MDSSFGFKCGKEDSDMSEDEYLDICDEPMADSERIPYFDECVAKGMDVRGIEVCYTSGTENVINFTLIVGFPADDSGFRQNASLNTHSLS